MFLSGLQTEIFETVYCSIVHLSFLTSHSPLFFSLCKTSKNSIFGFSVVFPWKTVPISIFKVEYLENGLADFNDFGLILQDFGRAFRWNQLDWAVQFSFNLGLEKSGNFILSRKWQRTLGYGFTIFCSKPNIKLFKKQLNLLFRLYRYTRYEFFPTPPAYFSRRTFLLLF